MDPELLRRTAEFSRRARGFAVYAALRELRRGGVAALVERCCRCARLMAEELARDSRVTVLNNVVLNQVLVRFACDGAKVSVGGSPNWAGATIKSNGK